MILLGADAKSQHHDIKKCMFRQLYAAGAVVVAGIELQLVDTAAVIVTLQQRRVATAIAVGQGGVHQLQLLAFDAVQLDLDRAARAAVSGIQYMRGQTSHCLLASVLSVGKKSRTAPSGDPAAYGCRIIKTFFCKIVHNNSVFFPDMPTTFCKYAISRKTTLLADERVIN
ncbi:hypothetical protein D3C84_736910 [compost metagenome]